VHAAVKQAWTAVLDHRSFEANTPFDDAGGDSLDGLHLWSLIENTLNAQLSFDSLCLDMTPRALTEAVQNQLTRDKRRLGQVSNKPQVFYMPTAEGDTFLQSQLRAGISADVSFEIIRYPSTFDFLENEANFEALIEAAVGQIVEKTDQPCNILGYSFGGFVAWATACRLKQLGRPLGFIGLIDARRSSEVGDQGRAATRWHQVLRQLLFEPRYAAVRALQRGVALIVDTGSIKVQRKVYKAAALLSSGAAFRAQLHFTERLRIRSGRHWKPAALDHPVCLFRSDEYLPNRPDFGWGNVCPRLEIVDVGGTHESLLHLPDRDTLCRRVVQRIESSIGAQKSLCDLAERTLGAKSGNRERTTTSEDEFGRVGDPQLAVPSPPRFPVN
jgi:thioesterase domain-containing protein